MYKKIHGSDEAEERPTRERSRLYVNCEEEGQQALGDAIPLKKIQGSIASDDDDSFSGKPVVGHYEDTSENGRKLRRLSQARADHGSNQAFYTAEEERTVVHQLDRKLVLFLAFLYMLSFLDRSSLYIPFPVIQASFKG